jgi:uncharacterized membrane protein YhaH (DUF805 family)
MDWTWFLFSFKGRINRAKCWLAALIIVCWMIFLSGLIAGIGKLFGGPASFGFNLDDIFLIVDPASLGSLSQVSIVSIIVHGGGTRVFLWVYLATSIKRLHDRDKSGWWMVPFFVVPGLYGQFEHRLPNSDAVLLLALAVFVLTVWGLCRIVCPERKPIDQPVRSEPAAGGTSQTAFTITMGSAPRNRIQPKERWPTAGMAC